MKLIRVSEDTVRAIRKLKGVLTIKELSKKYNVSMTYIVDVQQLRTRREVV